MTAAPLHPEEEARLKALHSLDILDTPPDPRFDRLTKEAVEKLQVLISTISILDKDREWFKSCQGTDLKEGPREIAFCSHALLAKTLFVIEDTREDKRFKDNPYVTGKPFIRFYAGMALVDRKSGLPIGVFCVKDTKPRKFTLDDIHVFLDLAHQAEDLIQKP